MSVRKLFREVMGHQARKRTTSEEGTDMEEDDQSRRSDETESTEKGPWLFGIPVNKFSCSRLPRRCIRATFLVINGPAFIAGITAVSISTWTLIDSKPVAGLIGQRIFVAVLLVTGLFGSVVSFLGTIGFLRKQPVFLNIYITSCSLFLWVMFVCATISTWLLERMISKVETDMSRSMANYESDRIKETWDDVHGYLKCCGVKSYKDWPRYSLKIPQSCCSASIDQCVQMTGNVAYKQGCLSTAVQLIKSYIHLASISALVISFLSFVSLYLACRFRKKIKRHSTR